jgi:hypothetical protein
MMIFSLMPPCCRTDHASVNGLRRLFVGKVYCDDVFARVRQISARPQRNIQGRGIRIFRHFNATFPIAGTRLTKWSRAPRTLMEDCEPSTASSPWRQLLERVAGLAANKKGPGTF